MFYSLSHSIHLFKWEKWNKPKAQAKKLQQLFTFIGQWDRAEWALPEQNTWAGPEHGCHVSGHAGQHHIPKAHTADTEFTCITYTPLPKSPSLEGSSTTVTKTLGSKWQNTSCASQRSYFSKQIFFIYFITAKEWLQDIFRDELAFTCQGPDRCQVWTT